MRIVLDSNVYISAALSVGGLSRSILKLAEQGVLEIAITDAVMKEIERVLRQKLGWAQEKAALWNSYILSVTDRVEPRYQVYDCIDPDDNHILECALEVQAQIIVTGDNHLLQLHPYRGINILTPRQFLESAI